MTWTLSREAISTRQQKIATLARQAPERVLTTLAHHIDHEWMAKAYQRTRKDGATGVDGVTAAQYEKQLEANLDDLLSRLKTGRYRAPPARRVHIPKGRRGETRPLGIPTLEDKVLQRAVLMALEPIFEQDFLDCSWGFRPGRSPHQALDALWQGLMKLGGGWVIDLDIRRYFETIDHRQLRAMLDQRVRDGVIRRALGKWMNAGVMESGIVEYAEAGTPQGGVISPLLSNIYLHEVLDKWFEHMVKPRLSGRAQIVRFADDAVLAFEHERDAHRVMAVLDKRFARFGLTLHPDKTRLVDFRPPSASSDRSLSFDLLGFTHYWGRSRKGRWVIKRKTAKSRFARAVQSINQWCRSHRHDPIDEQHAGLTRRLRGHYAYYGITGNGRALARLQRQTERCWRKWLNRRSNRSGMNWDRFCLVLALYPLPPPRVVHSVYRRAAMR